MSVPEADSLLMQAYLRATVCADRDWRSHGPRKAAPARAAGQMKRPNGGEIVFYTDASGYNGLVWTRFGQPGESSGKCPVKSP